MTKFGMVTRGRGVFLWVSHVPILRGASVPLKFFWTSIPHTIWVKTNCMVIKLYYTGYSVASNGSGKWWQLTQPISIRTRICGINIRRIEKWRSEDRWDRSNHLWERDYYGNWHKELSGLGTGLFTAVSACGFLPWWRRPLITVTVAQLARLTAGHSAALVGHRRLTRRQTCVN